MTVIVETTPVQTETVRQMAQHVTVGETRNCETCLQLGQLLAKCKVTAWHEKLNFPTGILSVHFFFIRGFLIIGTLL